jgi:hypothetical protein
MPRIRLLKCHLEHPLAVNFPIINGEVTFTVPENATTCINAIVVCTYRLTFCWAHFLCVFFSVR